MFASISLTTYNRTKLSEFCINSILKTTPRDQFEFIVVDNSSPPDTVEMLKRHKKDFDKLVLNHKNNLASAINSAWRLANPDAEWLIVFSNDDFCMNGWFENFKLVIKSELNPDVIFCQLRMPDFERHTLYNLSNGGTYHQKQGIIWFGAGLAIKKKLVDLHNLKFIEGDDPWSGGSIYSYFGRDLNKLGLKIVHLGKPCTLVQDCEYSNPEYAEYYKKVFSYKDRKGGKLAYNEKIPKYESLRLCGGHTKNPEKYYEGSGYKISKHYKAALASKEGKAEFARLEKIARKAAKK